MTAPTKPPLRPGGPRGPRAPDWFKQWCLRALDDPKVRKQIKLVIRDAKHPAWKSTLDFVAMHGVGRPAPTPVELAASSLIEQLVSESYSRDMEQRKAIASGPKLVKDVPAAGA